MPISALHPQRSWLIHCLLLAWMSAIAESEDVPNFSQDTDSSALCRKIYMVTSAIKIQSGSIDLTVSFALCHHGLSTILLGAAILNPHGGLNDQCLP